jgi:kinetochore protein NNF1
VGISLTRARVFLTNLAVCNRPHTLPPDALLAAHLAPFLHEQHAILNSSLQSTQDRNKGLADEIDEQKTEIEALVSGLESIVKDLETAAGMVQTEDVQNLSADVRDMEAEIRAG